MILFNIIMIILDTIAIICCHYYANTIFILIGFVFLPGICIAVNCINDYDEDEKEDATKIKFSNFISFYNINPYAWELNNATVSYKVSHTYSFNFIDTCKYKCWHNSLKKKEYNNRRNNQDIANLNFLITDIQKTINKIEQQECVNQNKIKDNLKNIGDKIYDKRSKNIY